MLEQDAALSASQLQMARKLFEAACSDPSSLEAILNEGCRGDPELRALVEELMAADGEAHPILDRPLCLSEVYPEFEMERLAPGAHVGPYRIVREIGFGGMGAIYLAELVDAHAAKLFALKVVRWWSPELSRRFQQEEAILRRLSHPNIAQMLDSDMSNGSCPYIVMEYVEGQPIHSFCGQKSLSLDEKVLLFRQVCSAVRYLHQNLVVHRDLKPTNVLVTADGTVKLVDFGIAKLLQGRTVDRLPLNTTLGLMTPNYASPEQVRGAPTTTLTDVYSLGVLLYELLSGMNPFAASGLQTHEILRRICEEEPEKPSAAVSRVCCVPKLRNLAVKNLRGELDNIVLKSIHKDPQQRYESVEQFDEDLSRYLDDLPVIAQGFSFSYRTRKFLVRYKTAVAVGIAMFLLLAGGIVATSIEARIARNERARAEVHAKMAEDARALAERERATAERQTVEAERQKAAAERRLAELQTLAHGAAQVYAASREGRRPADASLVAQNSRDLLKVLRREHVLDPAVGLTLGALSNEASNPALSNHSWRVPTGWRGGETQPHEYSIGIDHQIVHGGKSSLLIHSIVPYPHGRVYVSQSFRADRFKGKRVRLVAFLKPENVTNQAFLYLTVNKAGDSNAIVLRTGTSGTKAWKKHELVTDVPTNADSIAIIIDLNGPGAIRADDLSFSSVDRSVSLTEHLRPNNLDFSNTGNSH